MNWLRRLFGRKQKERSIASMWIPPEYLADLRDDDVFIVSYPRGGNRWTRQLLCELAVAGSPGAQAPERLTDFAPDIHIQAGGQPAFGLPHRLLKSHNISDLKGRRMVYIFRDAADSLVSYYHFRQRTEYGRSRAAHGIDAFCQSMTSSWVDHMRLGLEEHEKAPGRVLLIAYSMLHGDTVGQLRRLAKFCEVPATDEILQRAAENCSFEAQRKRELAKGEGGAAVLLRKGVQGSAREEIKPELLEAIRLQTDALYNRMLACAEVQIAKETSPNE